MSLQKLAHLGKFFYVGKKNFMHKSILNFSNNLCMYLEMREELNNIFEGTYKCDHHLVVRWSIPKPAKKIIDKKFENIKKKLYETVNTLNFQRIIKKRVNQTKFVKV